jgi:hypothetical protein
MSVRRRPMIESQAEVRGWPDLDGLEHARERRRRGRLKAARPHGGGFGRAGHVVLRFQQAQRLLAVAPEL